MLPWFAANGFGMVRGHNVIWPSAQYLPTDVQTMLKANPVDAGALRSRVNKHIADVMAYTKGKVTEWDVLNEPYTNKDLQAVLGDPEMTSWFRAGARRRPRGQALHQRLQHTGSRRLRPAAHQRLRAASSGTCSPPERPSTASACNRTSIPT